MRCRCHSCSRVSVRRVTRVVCAVRRSLAARIKRFAERSGYRRALVSGARGCNVLRLPADVAQLVEQRFRKP